MHFFSRSLSIGCIFAASALSFGASIGSAYADDVVGAAENPPLRIGVIGAGWMGGTVGKLWVKSGYEVLFSTRHPEELKAMIAELSPKAHIGTPREAAAFGNVVLIATPYSAIPQIGQDYAQELKGKIVLDATNPSAYSLDTLAREASANGVGVTSAKYLPGTTLVRAFSAVDATEVEDSFGRSKDKLGVPVASNNPEALKLAAKLVSDAGCEPVIVGDLDAGKSFQRGGAGFRANTTALNLRRLLKLN
jgi:predicted dinucleotide-binding enzyme